MRAVEREREMNDEQIFGLRNRELIQKKFNTANILCLILRLCGYGVGVVERNQKGHGVDDFRIKVEEGDRNWRRMNDSNRWEG